MNYERIIVFGAHPDDELTMSATIRRMTLAGVRVVVVTMSSGNEGYSDPSHKEEIVRLRQDESKRIDELLGIQRHVNLMSEDMAVLNDKATLHRCIQLIREERPQAVFTHGPIDNHRDHLATHAVTVEARWHAGEPVSIALGEPWRAPHLYYYKGFSGLDLPTVRIACHDHWLTRAKAWAMQSSQLQIFHSTEESLLDRARKELELEGPCYETFAIAERNVLGDFLPL